MFGFEALLVQIPIGKCVFLVLNAWIVAACDAKLPIDVNDKRLRACKYQNFLACGAVHSTKYHCFCPAGPKIFENLMHGTQRNCPVEHNRSAQVPRRAEIFWRIPGLRLSPLVFNQSVNKRGEGTDIRWCSHLYYSEVICYYRKSPQQRQHVLTLCSLCTSKWMMPRGAQAKIIDLTIAVHALLRNYNYIEYWPTVLTLLT